MAGTKFNDLPDFAQDEPGVPLDKIDNLLDWIYEEDISDKPNVREYKVLKRIMRVMKRFYNKGAKEKKEQFDSAHDQLKNLKGDIEMCKSQLKSLEPFPDFHPRKKKYMSALKSELERMEEIDGVLSKKVKQYGELHVWGLKVADAIDWLSTTFDEFCNNTMELGFKFKLKDSKPMSAEVAKTHLNYLNEVTFNLQESIDFFEASVDGRLNKFYQIEKCMVEAQEKALESFPEGPRKTAELKELAEDKSFIMENMKEGTDTKKVWRKRMTEMHKDFFRVLRWNRKKLKRMLGLDETLEEDKKEETKEKKESEKKVSEAKKAGLFDMPSYPFDDKM